MLRRYRVTTAQVPPAMRSLMRPRNLFFLRPRSEGWKAEAATTSSARRFSGSDPPQAGSSAHRPGGEGGHGRPFPGTRHRGRRARRPPRPGAGRPAREKEPPARRTGPGSSTPPGAAPRLTQRAPTPANHRPLTH